jgi:CO dehydrogenase/acetyl-CoA synthase delta subunit
MSRQRIDGRNREHGRPVLLTFTAPNHNLPLFEIDVFDAQLEALVQSKASAVEERHDDPRDAIKVLHDPRDLITAQHHRYTNRHPSARDVFDRADLDV